MEDSPNSTVGEQQGAPKTVHSYKVAAIVAASEHVEIMGGGAVIIASGANTEIKGGGAALLASGGNMQIEGGGGQILAAGGDMTIREGGGGIMLTGNARIERGFIGMLISGNTTLNEGTRVILNTPQALAFGAAFGLVFAFVSRGLRRRESR
jgi:hypothetical protein